MRRMFTPFAVLLFLLLTSKTYSQIVWTFNDSLATPSVNSYADVTVSPMTSNNSTLPKSGIPPLTVTRTSASGGTSGGYTNNSGTFNLGAAADSSLTRGLNPTSAYFEFTITPTTAFTITSIRFGLRSTSTGPRAFAIRSSADDFFTDLLSDTITNNARWSAKNFTQLNIVLAAGTPVTMRIYGYGGAGNLQLGDVNWRIDDVTINSDVLPVSLNSFTASVASNKVLLNWAAANEVNLKGFSVEKSSDARTFREVSFVSASGKGNYSAQDAVSNGAVYYRLKIVNSDGSFVYSKNVLVNASLAGSSALRVYPNPVLNTALVSHPQAGASASLKVTDLNGRVLQAYSLQQNAVQTSISLGKLMSGTYLLVYRDANGKAVSTRIIKN